jgi:hypothetical protein
VLTKAMQETLGADAETVAKELGRHGIPRNLGQKAIEIAREHGRFTIFALVDALTRLTQKTIYVGDRTEADEKVAALLATGGLTEAAMDPQTAWKSTGRVFQQRQRSHPKRRRPRCWYGSTPEAFRRKPSKVESWDRVGIVPWPTRLVWRH